MPPPPPQVQAPARLKPLGNVLMWLLIGMAVVGVVEIVAAGAQWATWRQYLSTPIDSFAEADAWDATAAADNFHSGVVGLEFLAMLGIGVVFIVWLFRAARNTERFGATGGLPAGWAIASWFVPFANLAMPAVVLTQTLRASHPGLPRPVANTWRQVAPSALVVTWWLCWIGGSITGFAAGLAIPGPDGDLSGYDISYAFFLLSALLGCAAAVLAALVVRQLTNRQEQCLARTAVQAGTYWAAQPPQAQPAAWLQCPACAGSNFHDATTCWQCGSPTRTTRHPVALGSPPPAR